MSSFFVNTQDGRVATLNQLAEAAIAPSDERPKLPWHPIQGPDDASTIWYSVLRKKARGVFIGTLCIRHTDREALLVQAGWETVEIEAIGL